jgi:hypothetical protein
MAFRKEELEQWEPLIKQFISEQRPPEKVRDQVDLDYVIEKQSIIIFEIRPRMDAPEEKLKFLIAKATWVRRQKVWKIYWQQADMEWHKYEPLPQVDTLELFIDEVDKDPYACFWG